MIKHTFFLLFSFFFFTACAERGFTVQPSDSADCHVETKQQTHVEKNIHKTVSINTVKKTVPVAAISKEKTENTKTNGIEKIVSADTSIEQNQTIDSNTTDNSPFVLDEETKNTISGIFVLIIGIIILL